MNNKNFVLHSAWPPSGDQPEAISALIKGVKANKRFQTLMGVTGSGKTFTMANVIAELNRPALILAHNKTLAAQLYSEFKNFFPENAVHYFVSYYDYYQPEAYIPSSDIYIEKDASINDRIEKLRLAATKALIERRDVIVVASVSCIYGLGKRENYENAIFAFKEGERVEHRAFMERLIENYYERNDLVLEPGKFRVRGDTIEIFPAYDENCIRVTFYDDEIERIDLIEPLTGHLLERLSQASIFPAQHYVTQNDAIARAVPLIEQELESIENKFLDNKKYLEAERIKMRTKYDLEMLSETGYCSGIENYSLYLDGRNKGEPPGTLIDFFPDDFIMFIDESHITLPQVRAMFNGDRARKQVLVDNGFRLPSCLDNRPLEFKEFEQHMKQAIFVSATPGDYELANSEQIAEQIIRPTGVPDPEVEILPAINQVDDLIKKLKVIAESGERALVLTLTKRSSEDLAEYLSDLKFKVKYIHSELNTFERAELIRDLRNGDVQILVGINLLREGMDLPEVTLVAILDADREGYLRSHRSLIQIMGRAARNINSKVILYADNITEGINKAVSETRRRRGLQIKFNKQHNITPKSIEKGVVNLLPPELAAAYGQEALKKIKQEPKVLEYNISELERLMWDAVEKLDFERAAALRDKIAELRGQEIKPNSLSKAKKPKARERTRK